MGQEWTRRGGVSLIKRHLSTLYDGVLAYLEHEEGSGASFENAMLNTSQGNAPEQPEPLAILYTLRNHRTTYSSGGLSNQPAVLMMELNECIRAENEHARIQAVNQRLKEQFEAKGNAAKTPS